jgi:tRNA threonylcarbamoyladenosine biosynthesis protein TsaB
MWLAMDTATDRASVALGRLGSSPLEEEITGARRHAAALLPTIQALLARAGISLDQLQGVVLSDGPGSFTGLRVGAAVAKALVHTRNLPLWVAPSLLTRAWSAPSDAGGVILSVANALRGEIYAAAYRFSSDGIETVLSPSVHRPSELVASGLQPSLAIGDAPPEILATLESWTGRPVIHGADGAPSAARLLQLVGRAGGAREVENPRDWEPVYGRPAEAQARWESAHGRPLPDSVGSSR